MKLLFFNTNNNPLSLKRNMKMATLASLVVGVFGSAIVLISIAATPTASVEPETGTLSGGATQGNDVNASNGMAVKFAITSSGTGQFCSGKPDASCTGVPTGTPLTIVNGDLTVTTNGTTVDGKDIHGFLTINASNVIIKNTIVRGRTATGNGAYINITGGTNILIEDTEVSPTITSVYLDGIWGSDFIGRRLDVSGGVDGMKIDNNVTIESSYIHDLAYFSSDPNQGGGSTHNDAIQILEGDSINISNNNLLASITNNAAIQVTQDYGYVTNLTVNGNWLDGGGCTINIAHKVKTSLSGVSLLNNRFGRNSSYNCPILLSTQSTVTLTNNVWDNNAQVVPVQVHD